MLLLAAAALGGIQLSSCIFDDSNQNDGCTLAGCGGGFRLETRLELPLASFHGAEARVCRRGECRSGRLEVTDRFDLVSASLAPSGDSGPARGKLLVGALATDEPGVTRLLVEWDWETGWSPKQSSDTFEVYIDADGMSLFARRKTLKYSILEPNGAECGPTCYGASITD